MHIRPFILSASCTFALLSACSGADPRDATPADGGTASGKVIRQTCGGLDPLKNVSTIRVTRFDASADGGGVTTETPVSAFGEELTGLNRERDFNVVVEGVDTSGRTVSRGETGPLAGASDSQPRNVYLRLVDSFTPANLVSGPATCSKLTQARAGHVATKLSDGRVLITGGFRQDGANRAYISKTEIFDPRTGETTAGPDILTRTFHTATQLLGTKYTLIAGGEVDGKAISAAQLYDQATNSIVANIPMKSSRTRHVAVLGNAVEGGPQPPLVLLGGFSSYDANTGANPLTSAEVLDLSVDPPMFHDVSATLGLVKGLAEATAVPLTDGSGRVAVVGGWDGQNPSKELLLLQYSAEQNGYIQLTTPIALSEAHLWPVAASFPNGLLIVTGGFQSQDSATGVLKSPVTTTEYVNVKATGSFAKAPLAALPDVVGFMAGSALLNGKVLVVGGQTSQSSSGAGSIIELVDTNLKRRSTTNFSNQARHLHAATLLDDGTVLITGGLQMQGSGAVALDQIDVFQPAYVIEGSDPHH